MKNGTCPKCGSESIYCGDKIPLKNGPFGSNSIPVSIISMAALDNYVCTDCGYLESYIAGKNKRKEIAEGWRNLHTAETADETENG